MAQAAPRPVEVPTAPATFLQGYPQALPRELCEQLIARFEKDERKHPSRTATRVNPLVRTGTMLDIPLYPEWADVCNLVTRVTRACLDDYVQRYPMLQSLGKPENCLITPPFHRAHRAGPGLWLSHRCRAGRHL